MLLSLAALGGRRARPLRILPASVRCMTTSQVETARSRHQRTLSALFAVPTTHSVRWSDVISMVEAVGGTYRDTHGKGRLELSSRLHFVHKPSGRHAELGTPEVLALRAFLHAAGVTPADALHPTVRLEHNAEKPSQRQPERIPPESRDGRHVLAVIGHREARLFDTQLPGSVPRLLQHGDTARHLHHKASPGHSAQPATGRDYDAVLGPRFAQQLVASLASYDEIILAGHATGKSSAVQALLWAMPPAMHARVVAVFRLNEGHVTSNELTARARRWFAQRADAAAAVAAKE